jgi:hypothetical protein
LSTHDVCENPTIYGVTLRLFEETVKYAVESGAQILTVAEACTALLAASPRPRTEPEPIQEEP